jgi:hypothetical protein
MLLKDRRLWIYDDEELINELANVRLKEPSPGLLRMDHDPQRHEDRAIAVALAALGENPTGGRVGSGLEAMGPVRRRDSFDHVVTAYNPHRLAPAVTVVHLAAAALPDARAGGATLGGGRVICRSSTCERDAARLPGASAR